MPSYRCRYAHAVYLTRGTVQSLIAHNNRRLQRAGLSDRQIPLLPERQDYNTYGRLPSLGESLFSSEESESDSATLDNLVMSYAMNKCIGPQSRGYPPTAYASPDEDNLDEDEASSEGPNKHLRQK